MNFCPACGNALGAAGKFCDGCGYKLDSINVPPPPGEAMSDADFSSRFTSCLEGKGFQALSNAFKSKQGVYDLLTAMTPDMVNTVMELSTHLGVAKAAERTLERLIKARTEEEVQAALRLLADAGEEGAYEAALKLMAKSEVAEAEAIVGMEVTMATAAYPALLLFLLEKGEEVAPFIHALVDCAVRAGVSVPNFPYAREIVDTLDYIPVPPVMLAPPMHEQLPVQLPPPPPTWSPMVIPMEDPAPAGKKAGMSQGDKTWLALGLAMAGIAGAVWLGSHLPNNTNNVTGGAYYMHFSCGSSGQCAQANGGRTGVLPTSYSTLADCEAAGPQTGFVQQPASGQAGWFCSTSAGAGDAGP